LCAARVYVMCVCLCARVSRLSAHVSAVQASCSHRRRCGWQGGSKTDRNFDRLACGGGWGFGAWRGGILPAHPNLPLEEYCQHTLPLSWRNTASTPYPWRNTASTPYPFHGGILPAHPTPFMEEYCQHTLPLSWRNTASTPYPFHGGILPAHPTPFTFTIPTHRPTFVVAQLIPGPRHKHSDGALDYFPRLRWEPSTAGPSVISIFVFPPPKTEDVSFARVTASWNASSFFFSILFFGVGIPERRVRLRPRGCWRGRGRVGRWPVALGSFSERALS
jgi:hypothetical protein